MAVVARSQAEIRSALERMYTDHAQAVVHSVALATGSLDLAWDALQETFLALNGKLAAGLEIREEAGYLIGIAKRKAKRTNQRSRREQELAEGTSSGADPASAGMAGASLVWEACRRLNPAMRTAVVLHEVEDKTEAEIGEYLGTSRDSASRLVIRGRKEMLKRLVELVGRRRGCPPECGARAATIWSSISGELDFEAREHLRLHMASCSYCRETEDQLQQARSLGVLPLLIPLAEILRRRDQILGVVEARRVSARIAWSRRPALLALPLTILLIIGVVKLPAQLAPASVQPGTQPVAAVASPSPTPAASPSVAPSPTTASSPVAVVTPAAVKPPADPCPTGGLGGLAYLSVGRVMYRSSPQASSQVLDATGRADDLRWTPNGSTLVYKEVAASGSVAGSLRAVHPGGSPFWSFGTDIESYDISTDGGSIVALAQHYDTSGNWDGWILYIGPLGGNLTPHVVSALVVPGGPGWSEQLGAEPRVEVNYVPNPGSYEGVFWFGNTIYLAQNGQFATFDGAANQTSSGYAPLNPSVQALFASIAQPRGSAVHFSRRGVNLTSTCAGGTRAIVAPPHFTQSSSDTLMLCDDPINARAGLAVESFSGATGGDIYLVTADRQAIALTSDHHSYLALWRP